MTETFSAEPGYAFEMDHQDPLRGFRKRFFIPPDTIYMDGNSLGLLSEDAEKSLFRVVNEWRKLGIRGWLDAEKPWFWFAEQVGNMAAPLVGARPGEVILTGSTTVNIHSLLSSFYQPEGIRKKILADELNFPSDLYAIKGQLKIRRLPQKDHLILARAGEDGLLDESLIADLINEQVALVFLPSVVYSTGQLLDMEYLSRKAHEKGALIGFDCSHSVGALPHDFDKWGVDFAIWCSYKYLNGGPGSSAFLYVNEAHFDKEPLLAGWFGNDKEKQFDMLPDFVPAADAGRWQISSPCLLSSAPVEGSLKLIQEAGIEHMRKKSLLLTSYLRFLYNEFALHKHGLGIATPEEEYRRGGHLAFTHEQEAVRINEALKSRGIIPDLRPPSIIRVAPMALYNTFEEVHAVASHLKEILENKEYESYSEKKKVVS